MLRLTARRLNVELSGDGEVYFLGELESSDRATYLGRVGRLPPDEVEGAVEVLLTTSGQVKAFDDGNIVVSDKLEVVRRVEQFIDQLNAQVGTTWVVQFYVIEVGKNVATSIGIDGDFAVSVATGFDAISSSTEFQGEARAAFRADVETGALKLVARPLFLLVEGQENVISRFQRVPIRQQSITPEGTVVTSGFSNVDVGTQFSGLIRDAGDGSGLLEFSIEFGEVTGFVEDRPIVTEELVSGTVQVKDGGTYLIGSLERTSERRSRDGFLGLQFGREDVSSSLEVWVLAERVGGYRHGDSGDGPGAQIVVSKSNDSGDAAGAGEVQRDVLHSGGLGQGEGPRRGSERDFPADASGIRVTEALSSEVDTGESREGGGALPREVVKSMVDALRRAELEAAVKGIGDFYKPWD